MIRTIAVSAALLLASAQVPAPPPLVEKITVNVVNVDVTVMDRRGHPVRGLDRLDFEIIEDDQPQEVSNFFVVDDAAPRVDLRPDAVMGTAAAPAEERFRRRVLVLIDNLNTDPHSRNEAVGRLEKFVDSHFDDGRYDWSIATVDRRVHLLMAMTSDKNALHAVLTDITHMSAHPDFRRTMQRDESVAVMSKKEHRPNPSAPGNAASDQELGSQIDARTTLTVRGFAEQAENFDDEMHLNEETMVAQQSVEGIAEAARAFASTEGRKMILLVTGNLPLATVSPAGLVGGNMNGNHLTDVTRNNSALTTMRDLLVREANASNASFYIISAEGLQVQDQRTVNKDNWDRPGFGSAAIDRSAMFWLANETGGAFMPGNRFDDSFADFDRRAANYYALGFVTHNGTDSHYHHLTVRVKGHSEYKLQYRDGYAGATTDAQLQRSLRTTLGVSMQPNTLPVTLVVDPPQYRGLTAIIPVTAAMNMESLQYITDARGSRTRVHVYISVFDEDGRNIKLAKAFADITLKPDESTVGPMTITIPPIMLSKGTYRIVVAVRDELTDHVGVTTQKVQV
ncbi:MAG TPA: VWA domain-containing protein [Thermoanaerobaculia bacterium]|jgi:VWFA-related protein|nr:VWA domain-containing protein [Thermoanaerobaculia bacterium]